MDGLNMNYDDVMKLALERGFYFPSCEVYGDAKAGFLGVWSLWSKFEK